MIYEYIEQLERLKHQSNLAFSGPKYFGQSLQNSKRRPKKRRIKKRK